MQESSIFCAICSRPIKNPKEQRIIRFSGKEFSAHGFCLIKLRRLACNLYGISAPVPTLTRPLTLKEFLLVKRPKTSAEILCCIAYYQLKQNDTPVLLTPDWVKDQLWYSAFKIENIPKAFEQATDDYAFFTRRKCNNYYGYILTETGIRLAKQLPML